MRRALFALLLMVLATAGVGCPCVRSAVNANEGLRWWLFSNFGASRVCPEVLKRGVPIKLGYDAPSIGRFFPQQCQVRVDDASHTLIMHAGGSGYASLPIARRVGFVAYVAVEYRPDFRMEEDSLYVWGRFNRLVAPPDLRLVGVENQVVSLATRTPLGDVATLLGQGLVANELGRGFTVVRQDDGDDFTLGILMPPQKPKRPFMPGRGRTLLAADPAVLIGASAREYLGPLEVASGGAALYLKLEVQGAPLVWAVVTRPVGDAWRGSYEAAQPMGPPPGPVIAGGTMMAGVGAATVPLLPGQYYVVIENRAPPPSTFGVPIPLPLPEASSQLTYTVEVGDAP